MRRDIRRKRQRTSVPIFSDDQHWIILNGHQYLRVFLRRDVLIPQETRHLAQTVHDAVPRADLGINPLGTFHTVVERIDMHRQRPLHGSSMVMTFALEPGERQISTSHHQSVTLVHPIGQQVKTIDARTPLRKYTIGQQQRIATDIGQDHNIIRIQFLVAPREVLRNVMRVHMRDIMSFGLQRREKILAADLQFSRREVVESLVFGCRRNPGFSGQQHFGHCLLLCTHTRCTGSNTLPVGYISM